MKRHVFLVTWYASENYGTCLQAYAINTALKDFADIKVLNRRRYYSLIKMNFLFSKLWSVVKNKACKKKSSVVNNTQGHAKRLEKIEMLAKKNFDSVSINSKKDLMEIDKWADCYLVGSDQMWNPWMLSPHYLLDFVPKHSKNIRCSYAASFGVDNIPNQKKKIYKKFLPRFTTISVREPRAAELVKELSGIDASVVLDPTFLLTRKQWREFAKASDSCTEHNLDNYILCYFIGSPEFNHMSTVKKLAEKLGLNIVLLPTKERDYQENDNTVTIVADACAYDFVSLIDNAKLVCTDSFHAVVFSFLMETAFYDFPRFKKGDKYSQESRLMNIMEKFCLMDSVWKDEYIIQDISGHLMPDYLDGYATLEEERVKCLRFLRDMIEH